MRRALPFTFLLCLVAREASAEPPTFIDGDRVVRAERTGASMLHRSGKRITPVTVSYETGQIVRAHVDETAIVRIDPGMESEVEQRGGRLVRPLMESIGLWLVEDTTGGDGLDLAVRLSGDEPRASGVGHAIPNLYVRMKPLADYTPTDPRYPGQWYFHNIGMPEAWGLTRGDASTIIVIVDTGCDLEHPDLAAKMEPGRDVVDQDDDPSFVASESGAAHGTECAGLAAAGTDNDEGIAGGCPECRLSCVRMLSDEPIPLSADVDAFEFALSIDADVVSNSWGFVDPMPVPQALADALENLATNGRDGKGAMVLFAAGNDDRELGIEEIENVEGVLCVGAINNFDESTPFTNFGAPVDLVAPTGTLTTDISGPEGSDPTDYTNIFGGTSSACPVAAGVAALLVSAAPEKTSAELNAILVETTRPAPFAVPDDSGHDPVYGYGIIDPAAALSRAMGLEPEGGGGAGGGGDGGGGGGTEDDDGGCNCRAASTRHTPWALLLVALLLGVRRARQRSDE